MDADGHPDAGAIRRIRSLADRLLSVEEAREGLRARMNESEIADARTLIRWFRRRYDTPAKRLAYVRRAYTRWSRGMPAISPTCSPSGGSPSSAGAAGDPAVKTG